MTIPTTRSYKDPIVWTHLFMIGNVYLYAYKGFYILSISMMINIIGSVLYHLHHEADDFWEDVDVFMCRITLGCIAWYILQYCSWLQIILCVIWLLGSLVILELGNTLNYRIFHSLWHFMVFGGNLIVWSYLPFIV